MKITIFENSFDRRNMKKLLIGLLLLTTSAFATETITLGEIDVTNRTRENITVGPKIKFEKGNHFAVTTAFTENLLDEFNKKVMLTDEGETLYIYFDSPGGSVFAVSRMIGIMKTSNIKFVCVARFAASAAFMMFQNCNERWVLPDGVLMSHNAAGGFRGELPRVRTLLEAVENIVHDMEIEIVKKLNIDMKEYLRLINNNLWLTKNSAWKYAAIDGVVNNVSCSKALITTKKTTYNLIRSFFGTVKQKVTKSGCPLLNTDVGSSSGNAKLDEDIRRFRNLGL